MKIFLSALENGRNFELFPMMYNLMSYYYITKQDKKFVNDIIKNSQLILIDSGAHSFQKGKKVNWEEYTHQYAEWIKQNDCEKIIGYFEMDIDPAGYPYEFVLHLRKILESVSNKIIPVWHKNRGIEDYIEMCKKYSGKIIAITGFKNEDIKDEQYIKFLKVAWKYGCKVHCLGMTRTKILDKVPFDYVDSSTWRQQAVYGRVFKDKKLIRERDLPAEKKSLIYKMAYLKGMEMQKHYEYKWRSFSDKRNNMVDVNSC